MFDSKLGGTGNLLPVPLSCIRHSVRARVPVSSVLWSGGEQRCSCRSEERPGESGERRLWTWRLECGLCGEAEGERDQLRIWYLSTRTLT